ncbi:MAG: DNA polymerase III subunit alpha [Phascolarctobacterium sp.]|nr:DNA polymerase III subunit alpha [Phascolarctobacterium sp.]
MTSNFTHLHVHTQYSLLDGASKIPDLVSYAKTLGMKSLAITDHGVMYGAVDFYEECKKQGIKPILGCEVYVTSGSHLERNNRGLFHLILLAENMEGYHNLMKIVSLAQLEGFYYKPRVDKDILRAHSKGIICLSACIAGELPVLIQQDNMDGARRCIEEHLEIFGRDNYFLEVQNHDLNEEHKVNRALRKLAQEYDLKLVATNDLHYVRRQDAEAQDVLLCIQTTSTVDEPNRMRFPNDQFYLKSYEEMAEKFPDCPEALTNTQIIAERCNVELEFGHLLLPEFGVPEGFDAASYLHHLCLESLEKKYPNADAVVNQRLDFELQIINQMGYACYFLIVWDFIKYCREHEILVGPGRGSAAGSIVAYLLGITNIDPLRYNLLFERFLNPERVSMPDIDTDFCYVKRDKVLDYVVRRYGQDRVAQIITYGTLQARAAVRDVSRALGLSYSTGDKVAKMIPKELGITLDKALRVSNDLRGLYETDPEVRRLIDLAKSVEGMPRNVGTHAAGVIIAPADLKDYVPLQLGAEGSVITQYDKDKLEGLGLLKMDFLGLRTLTVIGDAIRNIEETTGEVVDIDNIPLDDAKTCSMLRAGDTYGVFQLESKGITKLVVDLAPESFEDLIPLVALYRPGPLGTGMAEDFIAGRHGHRTAKILHPLMEPILKDTYGVILYQEQVMQITSALAGFSLGQADILRRAMGKKKAKELDSMREGFIKGAKELHDIPERLSNEIFSLLQHFAGYGFNKSHSVAYALVAYQTAYLKANWPAQYMAAFLDSVITDADKISWYISKCRNSGIKILPPDVNESGSTFTVMKDGSVRFGLAGIKNVGEAAVSTIIETRKADGEFVSLVDFCRRVNTRLVNKRVVENLIKCGAMDSFGVKRSQMMAILDKAVELGAAYQRDNASGQIGLFSDENSFSEVNEIALPQMDEMPQDYILQNEKELIGFFVTGHPLDNYRDVLKKFTPIYTLQDEDAVVDGQYITIAGIITSCSIRNTRQGESMALLTLEDHTGRIEVIVFPKSFRMNVKEIFQDNIIYVEGRFNTDERETKIIASNIRKLPNQITEVHLAIPAYLENALVQKELKRIFESYSGNDEVYLHLLGSKKVVKTDKSFWVDSTKAKFKEEITKVLGKDCFI